MSIARKHFRYEHRSQSLLPRRHYIQRLVWHGILGLALILASLAIGILGYHVLEGFSWLDSLLNASMILGGMGPVNELYTDAGKLFASFYSLFAGIVFLVIAGILVAPAVHRFLHRLHMEAGDKSSKQP